MSSCGPWAAQHYDYYAQVMAKLERGHRQDVEDVRHMREEAKVQPARLVQLYEEIEPELYRYPAVDPASLRRAVEEFARGEG